MPNISDSSQMTKFVAAIETCQGAKYGVMTDWERNFVNDMAERRDTRDVQADLGLTLWNPSVHQWNTLMEIRNKVQAS